MSNKTSYMLPISDRPRDLVLPRHKTLWYQVITSIAETPRTQLRAADCVLPKGVRIMPPRRRYNKNIEVLFYDEVKEVL